MRKIKMTTLLRLMTATLLIVLICGLFGVAGADEEIACPIRVVWDDFDNAYGRRPSSLTLYFTAEGFSGKSLRLNDASDYTGSLSLVLRDATTTEYVDWDAKLSENNELDRLYDHELTFDKATRSFIITFSLKETRTITAKVTFQDMDDMLGLRPSPENFQPTLMLKSVKSGVSKTYDAGAPASVEDSGNGIYTVVWENVPFVLPEFDGDAATPSFYDTSYAAYLNTNVPDYTTNLMLSPSPVSGQVETVTTSLKTDKYYVRVRVTAENSCANNPYVSEDYKTIPENVTINVNTYDGRLIWPVPVELQSDGAKATGSNLLVFDTTPNFWSYYKTTSHSWGPGWSGSAYRYEYGHVLDLNYTLKRTAGPIYTVATVNDNRNAAGLRDALDLKYTLWAEGVERVTVEMPLNATSASASRQHDNTLKFPTPDPDGNRLEYSFEVSGLPAYYTLDPVKSKIEASSSYLRIDSVHDLYTRTVTADVVWDDARDGGKSRPNSVVLTLYCDGEKLSSQEVSNATDWKATWTAPALNAQGELCEYTIQQNTLPIYTTKVVENPVQDGNDPVTEAGKPETALDDTHSFTVTNTLQEDWNYYIDLEWDTTIANERYDRYEISRNSTDARSMTYKLTINVNAAKYKAGDLEVRLPYAHVMTNRLNENNSVPVKPSAIAVPKSPAYNINNAFNYYVDDMGTPDDISDDELVFVNWRDIEDSLNQTIEVKYSYYPAYLVDTFCYQWQAVGHGIKYEVIDGVEVKAPEEEISYSPVITYGIDTGTAEQEWTLSAKSLETSSYSTTAIRRLTEMGLYDPENYYYVEAQYELTPTYFNQHGVSEVRITAYDGGEILPVSSSDVSIDWHGWYRLMDNNSVVTDEQAGISTITSITTVEAIDGGSLYYSRLKNGVFCYIRYPKPQQLDENGQFTGRLSAEATFTCINEHENDKQEPYDYNDLTGDADEITFVWTPPVEWDYTGEIWSSKKDGGRINAYPVTRIKLDMPVRATGFYVKATFNGIKEQYRPFQVDVQDDALFVRGMIDGELSEPVRATEDDYEMYLTKIELSWSDRTENGGYIYTNKPVGDYLIQAQTTVNGPWQTVETLTLTAEDFAGSSSSYAINFDADKFSGKGYVSYRIITPEGLEGSFTMYMYLDAEFYTDSPLLNELYEQGMTHLYITNWCAVRFLMEDENGDYVWVNDYEFPYYAGPGDAELSAEDLQREGAYMRRHLRTVSGGELARNSSIQKTISTQRNNTVDGTVDVKFMLNGYEYIGSGDFAEELEDMCWEYGVYYDLLPLGYTYDASQPVQVYSAYTVSNPTMPQCSLVKVEVEDNYKGTQRQMVRFYVKHDGTPGENYYDAYSYGSYQYRTGFTVYFWAKAPWEQLSLFPYGYNVVGLQKGSLDETTGEIVYGGENNPIAKSREDNGGMFTVTHGANVKDAMSDLNGDGITTGIKDTLTASVYINPDFISAYQIGLAKFVKANSGIWKSHDVAYLGGEYRYKIRLTLGEGGTTRDLVLFDVLEDAANTEAATGEVFWKGKFRGVDTSIPTLQGIVPKVYYSTVQGLDSNTFTGKNDLTNEEIWSATPPQDLDTVTALAFDLTTSAAGGSFVFNKAMTTEVEIIMEAPELLPREQLAYNRSSYGATYKASSSAQATSSHNIGHRVTVALYDEKDFEFIKLGEMEEADPAGLSGVEFTLYKCSHTHVYTCISGCHTHTGAPGEQDSCWTTVIGSETSGEDGLVCFEGLTNGMYALVETGAKNGYVPPEDMWWTFEVDASTIGGITDPVNAGTGANHVSIISGQDGRSLLNTRLKTEIPVQKVWESEIPGVETRPASIKLNLYRNEELYREGVEVTPDADGTWAYTFTDLMLTDPEGRSYAYRVEEQPVPGYAANVDDSGDTVVITNTCLGQLEISKLVVDGDESKAFSFDVIFSGTGTPVEGEFTLYRTDAEGQVTTETVTADQSSLTVTAAHGESVRIVGLPVGAAYIVTEQAESGYTQKVTAGQASGTVQAETLHTVTFTNTYDASGEWKPAASKQINGQPAREDEVFTFLLESGDGTPGVRQEKTNNGGSITFDAIAYGLADIGKTYTYTVTETGTQEQGYTLDQREYTVTVKITDNGDGTLTAAPVYTVDGGTAEGILFENEYEATGEWTPEAVKTVNGQTPREDQVFSFELTGPEGLKETVSNDGSQALFSTIRYDLADLEGSPYTYTLKETSLSGSGYTVDETLYTVFVWLEDNRDGTLKVTKQIYVGGEAVDAISFDNTYEAEGQLPLTAVKTVNGQPPRVDQVFTFLLESGEGTPAVAQEKNNELGSVVFDPLTYTYADAGQTYTYTVSEAVTEEGHMVTDDAVYTVQVQITDNRDGTLAVTPTFLRDGETVQEISFSNILHAPLTICKTVTGPDTEETFPFTIRLYEADQTESTGTFAYTGDLSGQLSSGDVIRLGQNQSITITDLLPGMGYSVEEEPGVRYTGTVNGRQQTVVTGQCTEGGNTVAFDNVLVTTGLSVTKQWDGTHGGTIRLILYANGVKLENQPVPSQDGDTYSYTNLPKYDLNGNEIIYTVKEKYMDGYLTIYSNVSPHAGESAQVYGGGTIINREVVTFRIRKEWNGLGELTPPPITLTLYCNGEVYDRKQPAPDADGWYVYSNLPKYVGGEAARYTIAEESMSGFETYYYAADGQRIEIGVNGGRIVNVKLPDTGDRSPVGLWFALAGLAVIATAVIVELMKRRRG